MCMYIYIHTVYDVQYMRVLFKCILSRVSGQKKGFLFKKKKVDNVWQSRFFVLDRNQLCYSKKITVGFSSLKLMGSVFAVYSYDNS